MISKKATALTGILIVLSYLSVGAVDTSAQSSGIVVTPPSPVITDSERQTELAKRRAAVAAKIGKDSVMILLSTEPRKYANDVDFYYRQENNLYYLTNLKKDGATLVLIPGNGSFQEVLFVPKRDPSSETWNGRMYSREDAARISGIKTILDSSELDAFISALKTKQPFTSKEGREVFTTEVFVDAASKGVTKLYLSLPIVDEDDNGQREYTREIEFAKIWKVTSGYRRTRGYRVENARNIFSPLRLVKSPMEIKLMQHAIDITTEAQMRSWAMAGRAKWEYEVQAEVEYTFRRRNADYWGYPSIVGCGPNATTLHYIESQDPVKQGDLLLMDVGAEYDHYTADVTRTFPVNGKFSKEQAEIYQIVYDSQEAVAKATKPGATLSEVHDAGAVLIKQGLAKLGLITGPDDLIPGTQQPQYRLWFMHGTSHWLGMNVHDVGGGAKMEAGSIFTNEPGIYIREDALDYLADNPETKAFIAKIRPAFGKYKNIGVRIEDDMLVTATGTEWMTGKLPRSIADIEAFMARASKASLNYGVLEEAEGIPTYALMGNGHSLLNLADSNLWSPFAANEFPSGVTNRSGWVFSGKETAKTGLEHGAD